MMKHIMNELLSSFYVEYCTRFYIEYCTTNLKEIKVDRKSKLV